MSKSRANLVLDLQSQSLLHVFSYPWAILVCSPRYKILVCKRLTLGIGLPIVFFCFALDYPSATFVCSPRVAHSNLFYIKIKSEIGKINEKSSNSCCDIYSVQHNFYNLPIRSLVGNQLVLFSVNVCCGPFRSRQIKKCRIQW